MDLKVAQGTEALLDAFDRVTISELVNLSRPNSVKPQRRWPFGRRR